MRRREFLAAATAGGFAPLTGVPGATAAAPFEPRGSVAIPFGADFDVNEAGTVAYLGGKNLFGVVDVGDPANPTVLAERRDLLADREHGPLQYSRDVGVDGDRVAVCAWGWKHLDRPAAAFVLYDVTDPANPEQVAVHEVEFSIHNVALHDDVAYLVGTTLERWPVVVVDVADDDPEEIGRWSVLDANEAWAEVPKGVRRIHDLHVRGDRLYVANWDAGTWILDVSDPANPSALSHLGDRTPEMVLAAMEDNPDLNVPLHVETLELPGNATAVRPNGDETLAAVSQEASDVDQTGDPGGPGGVQIWDITSLTEPRKITTLAAPRGSSAHAKNFGWRGDRLYVGWKDAGVRVFDLDVPSDPVEVARWNDEDGLFHTARPIADGFAGLDTDLRNDGGEYGAEARLFTFPEPDGEGRPAPTGTPLTGVDRPPATSTTATTTTSTTATTTPPTTRSTTTTTTATSTRTTDATSRVSTSTTGSATPDGDTADGPPLVGVTALGALAAAGVGAWHRWLRE